MKKFFTDIELMNSSVTLNNGSASNTVLAVKGTGHISTTANTDNIHVDIEMTDSGATAGTYGSNIASSKFKFPVVTVDNKGIVTGISNSTEVTVPTALNTPKALTFGGNNATGTAVTSSFNGGASRTFKVVGSGAISAVAANSSSNITVTVSAITDSTPTDNSANLITSGAVYSAIDGALSSIMTFKGTLGTGGDVTALPTDPKVGDTYLVITAGTYGGITCEVGDMIICKTKKVGTTAATWTVAQGNTDGVVTGPASATVGNIATFNATTGKVIKDSGFTIATSVPASAVFTDTKYYLATGTNNG